MSKFPYAIYQKQNVQQSTERPQINVELYYYVLHNRCPCQYIFANVQEVYMLHLPKIPPLLLTSTSDLFIGKKTFTLQKFLQ